MLDNFKRRAATFLLIFGLLLLMSWVQERDADDTLTHHGAAR